MCPKIHPRQCRHCDILACRLVVCMNKRAVATPPQLEDATRRAKVGSDAAGSGQQSEPRRSSIAKRRRIAPRKVRTVASLECSRLVPGGRRKNCSGGVLNKQIRQRSFKPSATVMAWSKNDKPFRSAGISQQFSNSVLTHRVWSARACSPGTADFQACPVPGWLFSSFEITSKIECMPFPAA